MDGGGRLDRSSRSPRQKSTLILAAIGAAVLLRERLAVLARPPAKPRPVREQSPPRLIAMLERYLPNRVGVAASLLVLLGSVGLGVVKGGHVDELASALSDPRQGFSGAARPLSAGAHGDQGRRAGRRAPLEPAAH